MFGGWVDIWSESTMVLTEPGAGYDDLLLETGDHLLLEEGTDDVLLLEA